MAVNVHIVFDELSPFLGLKQTYTRKEVDAIVMAQVSMSVLEKELTNTRVPVYNSGRTSFQRVREMLLAMD